MRLPGDKSITHRALLLAALCRGASHLGGLLTSQDARSSAAVLRRMGVEVSPLRREATVVVVGRGRFRPSKAALHCGNSGTTARLLLGLLAGCPRPATLTGDRSLRRRPMRRVTAPLVAMGASVREHRGDGLPLTIRGGPLSPLRHDLPVSSAQIKGALLLAGVAGGVDVSLREPAGRSRDHTERLLRAFGYAVEERDGRIEFAPTGRMEPFALQVPGDVSSAAFLVGAALLAEGGTLRLAGVGLNPTRIGYLRVLERMGADIESVAEGESFGEPVGDLLVGPSGLRGTEVEAREIPGLIDEIPMLAALAARADGETVFREVGELRVKESDRLRLIAANLRAVGAEAEVQGNDLHVGGGGRGGAPPRGPVTTEGDHRIAMAFAVLGTLPGARLRVDDISCADVSFPGFPEALRSIAQPGPRGSARHA